ncbi:hypothetical protein [Streptomyces lavendulocolor]|uniref:hypothetical protein n=1 Tax=Streptomyces lavendulocolor TaxID=67316 RepID=UPI003C2B3D36
MARLIFDRDEAAKLRDSAREHATAGDGLLAYVLEHIATEGVDLSACASYDDVRARHGLGDDDAARTAGAA